MSLDITNDIFGIDLHDFFTDFTSDPRYLSMEFISAELPFVPLSPSQSSNSSLGHSSAVFGDPLIIDPMPEAEKILGSSIDPILQESDPSRPHIASLTETAITQTSTLFTPNGGVPPGDDATPPAPPPCGSTLQQGANRPRPRRLRRYKCGQCTRVFDRLSNLKSHETTHDSNAAKPHKCHCGKSFKRSFDLKRHLGTQKHRNDEFRPTSF